MESLPQMVDAELLLHGRNVGVVPELGLSRPMENGTKSTSDVIGIGVVLRMQPEIRPSNETIFAGERRWSEIDKIAPRFRRGEAQSIGEQG
ncbi:hypothetical protein M569_05470 [Genlisea aurea]|uniref:Uncharacterized protein n=1 Tax=Genlisea aurea TaxID=192259 RepID=S8E9W9_9LAMI|nr:hypothetical protein M569_05470 [Genlisea aurea]